MSLSDDCPAEAPAVLSRTGRVWTITLNRPDKLNAFNPQMHQQLREALERARETLPSEQGLLDLALVANLMGDVGAEVTACEQATELAPESPDAWARYAHALARTDRVSECLEACERALKLADDPEVRDLRDQVARMVPRELKAA